VAKELSVQFSANAVSAVRMLRSVGLVVHPTVLAQIVDEEGQAFVKRAREILRSADYGKYPQIVTGDLYEGVRFDVVQSVKGRLKGRFWVDCPYAAAVEYKTPRRQNPPTLREIIAWKRKKVPSEGIEGGIRAWKHIMKYGVQIHPFFWPAYRLMKNIVVFNISRRILALWKRAARGERGTGILAKAGPM